MVYAAFLNRYGQTKKRDAAILIPSVLSKILLHFIYKQKKKKYIFYDNILSQICQHS